MSNTKKTNNDADMFDAKIELRVRSVRELQKIKAIPEHFGPMHAIETVRVLDAFGGEGLLWKAVKKKFAHLPVKILVLGIDKGKYKRVQLEGDNTKFMTGMNLQYFDIIDLDAWGTPVRQLEALRERAYNGTVHCTFIQSMFGQLPTEVHEANGFSKDMTNKCKSLFNRNGREQFLQYIAHRHGVRNIVIAEKKRKHYLYFHLAN